jgi:hypothetical protein
VIAGTGIGASPAGAKPFQAWNNCALSTSDSADIHPSEVAVRGVFGQPFFDPELGVTGIEYGKFVDPPADLRAMTDEAILWE